MKKEVTAMNKVIERDVDTYPLIKNDINEILGKVSDDVLLQNIKEQVESVLITSVYENNILALVDDRYEMAKQIAIANQSNELLVKIDNARRNVYVTTLNAIEEKFNIKTNLLDSRIDELYDYINALYKFLVLNKQTHIIKILKDYIIDNKKQLVKEYKQCINKKDLLYKSFKKSIKNPDLVVILYNIEEIIDDFMSVYIQEINDTLIETATNDNEYEINNYYMRKLFIEDNSLTVFYDENFASILFECLNDNDIKIDIVSILRQEIINL